MNPTEAPQTSTPFPSFSVVITVRNEAENIAAVVEGLLAQSLSPAEIIIVDGESTDGTLEILKRYEAQGQLLLISQPCNIAQGRNIGIARACQYDMEKDPECTLDVGDKFPEIVETLRGQGAAFWLN